ncbi:MAG: chloride channel protein [Luteimonas sp.]
MDAVPREEDADLDLLSGAGWKRRAALWGGAVAVALAAILFAKASDLAFSLFRRLLAISPYWAFAATPVVFATLAWATGRGLQATRGSGIPQVIAALQTPRDWANRHLSMRVAAAKMALTVGGLLGGASIGREGPTVHVGAAIMRAVGARFGFAGDRQSARFLLAGGAAGIAAAFNTPLAGVVFAIEELSGAFEHRFSGTLLTAVIVGGIVSLAVLGNYTYFGSMSGSLPLGRGWLAVLACGTLCGLAGGLFSRLLLAAGSSGHRWAHWRQRHPVVVAAACGLLLAVMGTWVSAGAFGTGYEQARTLLQGEGHVGPAFGALKFAANLVSYAAGIPGGLFSPALAVGAGLGDNLSALLPGVEPTAVVLLGMCGYLAGVTQAPLTSAVITMEMTDNNGMLLPILATVLLARGASALVCRQPVYKALAMRLLAAADRETAAAVAAVDPAVDPADAPARRPR